MLRTLSSLFAALFFLNLFAPIIAATATAAPSNEQIKTLRKVVVLAAKEKAKAEEESPKETKDKKDDASKGAAQQDDKGQDEAEAKTGEKSEEKPDQAEEKADAKDKKDDAKIKKKKRKTFTVEPKRLKVDLSIDATFIAREMTEVVLRPESWSSFKIKEVVEHGAEVKVGDPLLKFDDEPLNDAIDDLELSQRLSELTLLLAEDELPRIERKLEMELATAKRRLKHAEEDDEEYRDEGRDRQLASMDNTLKQYRSMLEQQREELTQLEKMYLEDDLTEETEEIVLKRQRDLVEMIEFFVEFIEYQIGLSKNVFMPRRDATRGEALERVEMALSRTKTSTRLSKNRARYQLEQLRQQRDKSLEKHAKMTADCGLMTIKSPASGVVYYGRNVKGKWSDLSSMLSKLIPEKSVSKGQVLMTIVDPSEMYLSGTIAEKNLLSIAKGQQALVRPAAEGSDPLTATVSMVSDAPVAAGKYAVELELKSDELPEWLDPGMTGKAKVTTYDNHEALVVPKKAVHTDEFDETVKYVWVVNKAADEEAADEDDDDESDDEEAKEGDDESDDEDDADDAEPKVEKRIVRTGKSKGDDLEIVDGLEAGEVISLEDEGNKKKKD